VIGLRLTRWVLIGLPVLAGCDILGPQDCTAIAIWGLDITIVSAVDESPVSEGLRVTIQSGNYVEEREPPSNRVFGASQRPGRYTITVSAAGYETEVRRHVLVRDDGCHPVTRYITVELTPLEGA
jgi:hypothetical protein